MRPRVCVDAERSGVHLLLGVLQEGAEFGVHHDTEVVDEGSGCGPCILVLQRGGQDGGDVLFCAEEDPVLALCCGDFAHTFYGQHCMVGRECCESFQDGMVELDGAVDAKNVPQFGEFPGGGELPCSEPPAESGELPAMLLERRRYCLPASVPEGEEAITRVWRYGSLGAV